MCVIFFFSSRRRHTRCALVTGVQTCALPICYGQFDEIAWGRIKINLIRENWSDLIRLAGSIKLGHLKAAGVMRMLQVKDRPTTLAKALSELGRIIKTQIGRAHV